MKIDMAGPNVGCNNSDCAWDADVQITIDGNTKMELCEDCLDVLRQYCDKVLDIFYEERTKNDGKQNGPY